MALTGKGIFDGCKEDLQQAKINLLTDNIHVWGVNAAGQAALTEATSDFLDEVAAGNRTHAAGSGATQGVALGTKTVVGKTFDAANLVGTLVDPNNANGDTTTIIISKWDGVAEASSRLIAYVVLPAPIPQDGVDDDLNFDAAGVFDL